ncbi:hypothetical protein EGR_04115 [Echinococcus granulosus]|uniref:Uncharacterized protein n=1 Tax=Echinococcus granulosus TaxID=6210 RepID=W6URW6_ECHGR|nr:hypothetical protein EGR_04115 [Echinococcus granulosus]EUB61082.1 hypothetical protein EGR_04115 [Echinococcus granulosus]
MLREGHPNSQQWQLTIAGQRLHKQLDDAGNEGQRYSPASILIPRRLGKNTGSIPHYPRACVSVPCDRIPRAAPVPTNANLKHIPGPVKTE